MNRIENGRHSQHWNSRESENCFLACTLHISIDNKWRSSEKKEKNMQSVSRCYAAQTSNRLNFFSLLLQNSFRWLVISVLAVIATTFRRKILNYLCQNLNQSDVSTINSNTSSYEYLKSSKSDYFEGVPRVEWKFVREKNHSHVEQWPPNQAQSTCCFIDFTSARQ